MTPPPEAACAEEEGGRQVEVEQQHLILLYEYR